MSRPIPTEAPQGPQAGSLKRTKLLLFLTIFIAMLGLSVLFPVIGPLGRELKLTPAQIGWFSTAYSLMQFLFSPIWGSRSERLGRRPILVMGLIGFAVSFGLFGLFASLGLGGQLGGPALFALLVGARVVGGIFSSATLPTAQAMMADLSTEKDRAASMGLIGAAFGLGVVFGPAIGGLLSGISLVAPVYFSAGLAVLTAMAALLTLPETRRATEPHENAVNRRTLLTRGAIPLLLVVSALSTLASVGMEQTIAFYVQDTLRLTPEGTARTVGGMLVVFGLLAAAVQGGAIRPLSRRVAPTPLILLGLAVMGTGMLLIQSAHAYWPITAALALVGVGSAILSPTLSAALSLSAGDGNQGAVAGLNSSALALGRMTGPLLATGLYQHVSIGAPYVVSGAVLLALLGLMLLTRPPIPQATPAAGH